MNIAISGACYSGKTTFMRNFSESFPGTVLHSEVIRNYVDNIDEVRKDIAKYFELQVKIIQAKIDHEKEAQTNRAPFNLFDRSLADSLYYFDTYCMNRIEETHFLYPDALSFRSYLIESIYEHFHKIYDRILVFSPLDCSNNDDPCRPKDLKSRQYSEYVFIRDTNIRFGGDKCRFVTATDFNEKFAEKVKEIIV